MKKLLLLLLTVLLYTTLSQAQIIDNKTLEPKKVTKASIMGATLIEANWYDNYTRFIFEDSKYQILNVTTGFMLTTKEIDTFYTEIKSRFDKKEFSENEGFVFQTEEGTSVHVNFKKSMGVKSMFLAISKNNTVATGMYLTQKQVKKLFDHDTKS